MRFSHIPSVTTRRSKKRRVYLRFAHTLFSTVESTHRLDCALYLWLSGWQKPLRPFEKASDYQMSIHLTLLCANANSLSSGSPTFLPEPPRTTQRWWYAIFTTVCCSYAAFA